MYNRLIKSKEVKNETNKNPFPNQYIEKNRVP